MAILFSHHGEFIILVYTIHVVQENVILFAEASLCNIACIFFTTQWMTYEENSHSDTEVLS
jgi:hypothetical protein